MRDYINKIRNTIPSTQPLTGVEVGCYEGDTGIMTVNDLGNLRAFYMVDPYLKYEGYTDYSGHDQEYWDNLFIRTKSRFNISKEEDSGTFKNVFVKFLRMKSLEAVAEFEDASLDFVYIDANHAAEYVRQDFEAWFPKVRVGGVFSGHDYNFTWVKPEVDGCANSRGYKVETGNGTEWFFVK